MPTTPLRSHETEELRPERREAERLLEAGDLEGARQQLETWLQHEPADARARGLLGLCYFRLGRLDEAAAVYQELVDRNPDDPTLRVNLGLVALKRGDAAEAAVQFEVAVKLAPDHRKALNYLGVALAQRGELALARDAFLRAGATAMAERMEAQIAEAAQQQAPPPMPEDEAPTQEDVAPEAPPAAPAAVDEAAPAEAAPDAFAEAIAAEEAAAPATSAHADFGAIPTLEWPEGGTFAVGPEGVAIEFSAEIRTRLDGLVAARGVAAWTPLQKRFRGEEIDRLFGMAPRQVWRATGGGRLLFHTRGRTFQVLRLEGESYFVEERVFAFDEGLQWENGRLPGQATDLHLVRFTGAGQLLVQAERALRAEPVTGGCLSLPTDGLVGWSGSLTPRLVGAEEGPAVPWIELTGEGTVLLQA